MEMYQYNILRKNDGFLLIGTYFVIFILIVFAAVFFSQSVSEHSMTRKSMAGLEAKYNAERGIDYVLTEIHYNPSFHTHNAVAQGDDFVLQPETVNPLTNEDLKLPGVEIDGEDSYAAIDGAFVVKAYHDPLNPEIDEIVILAKGRHGDTERLFVAKYVPGSLYRFFIFTPYRCWFASKQFDAGGGSIHANQNFVFSGNATISNVTEMSTAQYLEYYVRARVPEGCAAGDCAGGSGTTWDEVFYTWRDPWVTPNNTEDPLYKYYNRQDGRNYGNKSGLLMDNGAGGYTTWDGSPGTMIDPWNSANYAIYANYSTVNGTPIQNYFDTSWSWNMYWQLDVLEGGYDSLGQTWYHDPVNIDVDYFNTYYQSSDWISFLETSPLEDIVMDANTGGSHIAPLSIEGGSTYLQAAQEGGIYIDNTGSSAGAGKTSEITIFNYNAGEPIELAEGGQIDINGYTVFEQKSFVDANSDLEKNLVKMNISALKQALGNDAGLNQQIIYSEAPIALSDAHNITEGGLTTVCERHVYLHGDYNTGTDPNDPYGTPRPSAVITADNVYTLSDNFYGFDESLSWPDPFSPLAEHNYNYPYENDFYCPHRDNGGATCIDIYFSGDDEEATHPDLANGRNWQANSDDVVCNSDNDYCMVNKVDKDYIYNLGLVGYRGYDPRSLERWGFYPEAGNRTTPPWGVAGYIRRNRTITGAFIQLESNDFPGSDQYDRNTPRRNCASWRIEYPGTPQGYCRETEYWDRGWAWDMMTKVPADDHNHLAYDTQFSEGVVPPGDLVGFSATIFLELENTTTNWTQHYEAISIPQT